MRNESAFYSLHIFRIPHFNPSFGLLRHNNSPVKNVDFGLLIHRDSPVKNIRKYKLKVYSNELFFISTNERLVYKFYKTYNYFIFK